MAVPKKRQSKSRRNMRRAHDFVVPLKLQSCAQCQTMIPSHVVCPNCGYYHGRAMVPQEGE
ncbi:MAG: 50S ribosomal protein L32 [Planctomycetota bacterium]|nr:MAG: 50S ribosomal protein L32 [Planctomycetota bacterium]